ncbi:MAG: LAGLIDADG family homing endonuclease [Candidatus Caldarchaeum sp.]
MGGEHLLSGNGASCDELPGRAMSTGDMVEGPASGVEEGPAPGPKRPSVAGSGSEDGRLPEPARPGVKGGERRSNAVRRPLRPRELRVKLYDEVTRLRSLGLSYSKIIKKINDEYGVRLRKSHVSGWIRRLHSPYNAILIPTIDMLKPSVELAYIIGVVAGDGYIRSKWHKTRRYYKSIIGLKVVDLEFAEEFALCLAIVLGREPPQPKQTIRGYTIEVACKTLHGLLTKPIDIEKLKPYIEHDSRCTSAFLRGFFDSEGSVSENGSITVCNTDIKLLEYVKQLLSKLGIEATGPRLSHKSGQIVVDPRTGKTGISRKDLYLLYIRASSLPTYYRRVGFTIHRKRKRLEEYLTRRGLL